MNERKFYLDRNKEIIVIAQIWQSQFRRTEIKSAKNS